MLSQKHCGLIAIFIAYFVSNSEVSSTCTKPRQPQNGIKKIVECDQFDFHPVCLNFEGAKVPTGWTVSFTCKQGYQIKGSVTTKCLDSSQWSHPTPACVALASKPSAQQTRTTCKLPPNIQNGKVELPGCQQPGLDYYPACLGLKVAILPELSEADYSCNRGFKLSGGSTIICEAGKWTPEPPRCIEAADVNPVPGAKTCPPLQTPAHATARCSSPTGEPVSCDVRLESDSTAMVTCNQFYQSPVGSSYLTCRGERWTTGNGFVCTPVVPVGEEGSVMPQNTDCPLQWEVANLRNELESITAIVNELKFDIESIKQILSTIVTPDIDIRTGNETVDEKITGLLPLP